MNNDTKASTIRTWQERTGNHNIRPGSVKHMLAEIADLRAALARAPMPDQENEKLRELLHEADKLLWIASGAMLKMGLRDKGSDCSLPHEVREFALEFSNEGRDGPGVLQVRGTGRYRTWLIAVRNLDRAAMSGTQASIAASLAGKVEK